MTINPILFWFMAGFGSFGAVSFLLAFFFHKNHVAREMFDTIEDWSDDFLDWLWETVQFIFMIILIAPAYVYTNFLLTKKVKLTMISKYGDFAYLIQKRIVKTLSDDEIVEYQNVLDGHEIYSKIGRINFELMDRINTNKEYWKRVSRNPSKEIIERFPDRLDWNIIFETTKLEKEIIEEYSDFVDWRSLVHDQSITEDFFFDFNDKIDIQQINIKRNRWLKKGRRSHKLETYLKLQGIDI